MSLQATVPKLRRNGRKPSCEPCRKSKYRCDHKQPVCARCQARGISNRCVYHPAPMTGSSSRRSEDVSLTTLTLSSTGTLLDTSPKAPSIARNIQLEHGYLGSTAYNAPFADNSDHLVIDEDEDDDSPDYGEALHEQITAKQKGNSHIEGRLKEAIRVLKFLQEDLPHFQNMFDTFKGNLENLECGVLANWLPASIATIRSELWEPGVLKNESTMIKAIERLFTNTSIPIILAHDIRLVDYMKHFSGSRIRWEPIALLLTFVGLYVIAMDYDDPAFGFIGNTEPARQMFVYRIFELSNICMNFCDEIGCTNDLYLLIMIENGVFASQVLGDTHHLVWRRLGDTSTAVFASGIHQQARTENSPFWLQETRRRCLALAYSLDKGMSCFLGRPPRIAKRYCNIELPLDLTWDELALEGQALEDAKSALNSDGWNIARFTDGTQTSHAMRSFVMNSLIKEDILEFCLGPLHDNAREKAFDLVHRNTEVYRTLPQYIDSSPEQWASRQISPAWEHVRIYLDYKYNDFLVLRALVRQLQDNSDKLLQLSHTLLIAVIEARNLRESCSAKLNMMQWLVVLYGLPPAGVLALELLQLSASNMCHMKVAQDLCVFMSYLRWIHIPGDGNFQLVDRARRTLQKIVDKYMGYPKTVQDPKYQEDMDTTTNAPTSNAVLPFEPMGLYDFSWSLRHLRIPTRLLLIFLV